MKVVFSKSLLLLLVLFSLALTGAAQKRTSGQTKTTVKKPIKAAPVADTRDTLEMVFVLDTTGSMGGLIEGAKQRIWGIINEVMQKPSRPRVRVGLVAYRDVGDEYVTKVLPITEDLDKAYTTLMSYKADGGGDEPENVRKALSEGIKSAGWAPMARGTAQIVFLVGDAPPQNYVQEPDVLATTLIAVKKNMIVNTIQCGAVNGTKEIWQTIAARGEGKYFAIAQDGGVQAIATPYDTKLAELATQVGQTYLTYGSRSVQALNMSAQATVEVTVMEGASMTAQADRAVNKAVNSFQYDGDIVQDVENEKIKIEDVKEDDLPDDLKKLPPAGRKKEIDKRIAERVKIRAEILELSKRRDAFLVDERKKRGQQNGFDSAVAEALREQLLRKGIK